jgi:nucleoid-associated protein YgaU
MAETESGLSAARLLGRVEAVAPVPPETDPLHASAHDRMAPSWPEPPVLGQQAAVFNRIAAPGIESNANSPQTDMRDAHTTAPMQQIAPTYSEREAAPAAASSRTVDSQASEPSPRAPIRFDIHVVEDGDTLSTIAEQCLGAASRANEIFELNRDILKSPDLLPIGVALRIPNEMSRAAGWRSRDDVLFAVTPLPPVESHLVVQGEGSGVRGQGAGDAGGRESEGAGVGGHGSGNSAIGGEGLGSSEMNAAPAASGRIHRVAHGETLTAIAHRYYGDAMRYHEIYHANRERLPNPHALAPGTELVIP